MALRLVWFFFPTIKEIDGWFVHDNSLLAIDIYVTREILSFKENVYMCRTKKKEAIEGEAR